MSATTQNNMKLFNDMFTAFMERAGEEDGPFAEYDESVSNALLDFWNTEENQAIFKKVTDGMKTKTKTARKSKKSDDDDKPKLRRPKSAYIFFCKEQRPDVVETMTEENGGEKPAPKDVLSRLGAEWKVIKASNKVKDKELLSKVEEMAAKDKAECHEENGTSDDSKSKKKKDDGKPKRAKSAYLYFCQANREEAKKGLEEENGEKPIPKEVTTELGRLWAELKGSKTPKDKKLLAEYEALRDADKARYEKEMQSYSSASASENEEDEDKDGDFDGADGTVENIIAELKEEPKKESKPKATESKQKRPTVKVTGYSLYAKEMREEVKEENPDAKGAEITKMLAGMWKELDEEEQDEFKERAKVLNES